MAFRRSIKKNEKTKGETEGFPSSDVRVGRRLRRTRQRLDTSSSSKKKKGKKDRGIPRTDRVDEEK